MIEHNKQPKGMYVLGFAEVFERLSYYTLSFLLVLYASSTIDKGGLGWTKEQALSLAGFYTLAAFTLPLVGGFLADKLIGTFRASILGAFFIIAGHACMLFTSPENTTIFLIALSCTASGTAFFKPSMPTLLGRLYKPTDFSREAGFKLYYMGINIGAMLAGFLSGTLLQHFGFRIALSTAGFGMTIGLIVLFFGKKHLVINDRPQKVINQGDTLQASVHETQTPISKKAFHYLILSFVFYAVWAVVYNIAISGTLSIYIEHYTQKVVFGYDIPTPFFQSLESIGIIVSAPLLAYIFHVFAKKKKAFHFFSQMNLSVFITFLAIAYFTYLIYKVSGGIQEGSKPLGWIGISIFILAVAVGEVLMSPVMMSAISLLSPAKSKTIFQAAYLTVIGLMGLVASKIGAISLTYPFQSFMAVTILAFAAVVGFTLVRKRMVSVALEAANETLVLEAAKKKIA